MSYAQTAADRDRSISSNVSTASSVSSAAKPLLDNSPAAAWHQAAELEQKAQESVKKIQQHIAEISMQTQQLSAPNASSRVDVTRRKVQDARQRALEIKQEAQGILERIPLEAKGVSQQDIRLRQAKVRKLKENLTQASAQVEASAKAYDQREADVCKAAAVSPPASSAPSSSASSNPLQRKPAAAMPGIAEDSQASTPEPVRRNSRESGVSLQAVTTFEAHEAEVMMHGELVNEFATDVQRINEDMGMLQQSMQQMAQITADQGEVLDTIESQMTNAVTDAQAANQQLTQASASQRAGNKRLWWLLAIAIVVMSAMILWLVITSK